MVTKTIETRPGGLDHGRKCSTNSGGIRLGQRKEHNANDSWKWSFCTRTGSERR